MYMAFTSGRSIAVCSQKGGVGKTTTVLNLGYALARLGHLVCLVDLDPQGALLLALNQEDRSRQGITDILKGEFELKDAIIQTAEPNLCLIGFGMLPPKETAGFVSSGVSAQKLKAIFDELCKSFEYCLVDCPPGLGILSSNVIAASDSAMVVMLCDPLAYRSIHQILEIIEGVQSDGGKPVSLEGILLTQYDVRNKTGNFIAQEVWENFPPDTVFQTVIPRHQLFMEASYKGVPIERMGRMGASLATRYAELAHEVIMGGAARPADGENDEIKPLL